MIELVEVIIFDICWILMIVFIGMVESCCMMFDFIYKKYKCIFNMGINGIVLIL